MKAIDVLRSHEREIKERFAVRCIGLFGSFVRGEEQETSDVDILVEFEEPLWQEGGSAYPRGNKPPHQALRRKRGGLG